MKTLHAEGKAGIDDVVAEMQHIEKSSKIEATVIIQSSNRR